MRDDEQQLVTDSLLVADVQLGLREGLQLGLVRAGVDPAVLHDLLEEKKKNELKLMLQLMLL